MITVIARWKIQKDHVDAVFQLLDGVVQATRKEPGNICYDLYRATLGERQVLLFEQYRDEAALEAHRSSEHFKQIVLEKIIPLLEERAVQFFKE